MIYEQANGLVRRGYRVAVVHSLNRRRGHWAQRLDSARDKLRDFRAGNIRRRVSWMTLDPRVEMVTVDRLDRSTTLPPADLWIGTFWRTTEFLAAQLGCGDHMMQLIQSYETWDGPEDAVNATWRLPIHAAVVSHDLKRKGVELGVPEHRLHVVPNGLDHAVYRAVGRTSNRPPIVAFQAAENPVKGLPDAIEVAHRVRATYPDARFLAFGIGRRLRALPDFVEYKRGLTGRALVDGVYGRASVMLCTSAREGWGFPSIEAMACGAALVSTRNGGVEDFAVHGESALLCDVGDVAELSNSVVSLLGDEAKRRKIAAGGMQRASGFTWESSTDAMERVVRMALRGDG